MDQRAVRVVFPIEFRAFHGAPAHPVGWPGFEEVGAFLGKIPFAQKIRLRLDLTQGRKVVNHPKRATLGSCDKRQVFNRQVGDRDNGQVELEFLPLFPIGETDINALFGAREVTPTLPEWLMGSFNLKEGLDIPINGVFVLCLALLAYGVWYLVKKMRTIIV